MSSLPPTPSAPTSTSTDDSDDTKPQKKAKPTVSGMKNIIMNYIQTLNIAISNSTWVIAGSTSNKGGQPSGVVGQLEDFLKGLNLNVGGTECTANILIDPLLNFVSKMIFPFILLAFMVLITVGNHYVYEIPYLKDILRKCESIHLARALKWAKPLITKLKKKIMKVVKLIKHCLVHVFKKIKKTIKKKSSKPKISDIYKKPKKKPAAKSPKKSDTTQLPPNNTPVGSKVVNGVLLLLLWAYFSSTVAIFTVLQPCSAENYMKPYPWIECTGTYYTTFIIIGVLFLLVYVIGTPVLFLILVLKHTEPLDEEYETQRIGFLYACYKSGKHWMFSVYMARRVVFCAITAFITDQFWTNMACVLLLLIFLVIHVLNEPFVLKEQNDFQTYEVAVLIITISCLQTLPFSTPLFALVVLGNAILLAAMIVRHLTPSVPEKPSKTIFRQLLKIGNTVR